MCILQNLKKKCESRSRQISLTGESKIKSLSFRIWELYFFLKIVWRLFGGYQEGEFEGFSESLKRLKIYPK